MTEGQESSVPLILPQAQLAGGETVDLVAALLHHFSDGQAALSDLDPELVSQIREEIAKSKYFGDDMQKLWLMLDKAITGSGRLPGTHAGNSTGRIDMLNLACGPCEEGAILSAFFSRGDHRVSGYAMDLRDREVEKGKRRYAGTEQIFRKAGIPGIQSLDQANSIEFLADDATHLVGYGQIPSTFDVIFIRHQNLWHDAEVWRKIYEFALTRIEPEQGTLIITSYFDKEHVQALALLKKLGGQVLFSERNPDSRELTYPGKSVDRHVALITQSAGSMHSIF